MDIDSRFLESACSENIICGIGFFECNICFDLAQDPIVTLCGHLFCWSCLYKWLHFHSHSHECPVCKSLIKDDNLVPIYGRGTSNSNLRGHPLAIDEIPSRPASHRPPTAPSASHAASHRSPMSSSAASNYFHEDGFGLSGGFLGLGSLTTTTLFSVVPSLLNFRVHGFHEADDYGATNELYAHGDFEYGFHHYPFYAQQAKSVLLKICFLFLGLLVVLLIISF